MRAMSGLRRALGEPLLRFIVIGALLFACYRLVHPERPAEAKGNRVELTADDVRQLEIVWTAQWHRAPTQNELQGLVEGRVREALALGLERGDTIIKRRLAQKMEFLADDLSTVRTPSVEELHAWYSRNSTRFAALITGGSRGIGAAIAKRLAADGASVTTPLAVAPWGPYLPAGLVVAGLLVISSPHAQDSSRLSLLGAQDHFQRIDCLLNLDLRPGRECFLRLLD